MISLEIKDPRIRKMRRPGDAAASDVTAESQNHRCGVKVVWARTFCIPHLTSLRINRVEATRLRRCAWIETRKSLTKCAFLQLWSYTVSTTTEETNAAPNRKIHSAIVCTVHCSCRCIF